MVGIGCHWKGLQGGQYAFGMRRVVKSKDVFKCQRVLAGKFSNEMDGLDWAIANVYC